MTPVVVAASTSRKIESAVIDLPEPDSPTMASFSPALIEKDTSSTTVVVPKRTLKCAMSNKGELSISGLSRVKGITQRVTNKGKQQHGYGE